MPVGNWKPRDIIAVIVGVGSLLLITMGFNSTVHLILLTVITFYFGSEYGKNSKGG